MNPFALFYGCVLSCLYLISLPLLVALAFKAKYKRSIPARFFAWRNPRFSRSGIWFHTCSLGETKAIAPLLKHLHEPINITTITQTGQEVAEHYETAESRFLPFEIWLPFWVTQQRVLVVLEAELWYLLFLLAKQRGAKTILLNARISEKSFRSYRRFAWLYRRIFAYIDRIYCQTEADKERLEALGATHITVFGNLKTLNRPTQTRQLPKPNRLLITAGSTHEGEEEIVFRAYLSHREATLVIVPRHPERFEKVDMILQRLCAEHQCGYHRYSEQQNFENDVILLDVMGELNNLYAISDIVILGGAFNDRHGGHNPIEPATFGCKIISGIHIYHQIALFEQIENYLLTSPEKLADSLSKAKNSKGARIKSPVDIQTIIDEINHVA